MFPFNTVASGGIFTNYSRLPGVLRHASDVRWQEAQRPGWWNLRWHSKEPLFDEPRGGDYTYDFLFRQGREGYVLASTAAELVTKLHDVVAPGHYPVVPLVRVHEMTRQLFEKPEEYSVTALHARINGYGRNLRSVSLYGDDLGEAALVRQVFETSVVTRVQLRQLRQRRDVLSIGKNGGIYFSFDRVECLRDVDMCLRFISSRGYILWSGSPSGASDLSEEVS